MIEFNDVSYHYPNQSDYALKHINFSIHEGEWVAILGRNGSGKSTLAKHMNGLLTPTYGDIRINGLELNEESVWDIRRHVGMVFQNPENQFVGTSVIDDVVFGLENIGLPREQMKERADESLRLLGLPDMHLTEPFHLSGGQKQRLAIAGILAMRPNVIVLDEATTMLDPTGKLQLLETIQQIRKQQHITTVMITHDVQEAAWADRVIILNDGEIGFNGSLSQSERIKEFGLELPFLLELTVALKERGYPIKYLPKNEEELVNQIWTYHSTK
ncbi:energy-coupling factor transporter ATPase [Aquisalibacillus elongatus]|uniref:Energy-coupling factor transport system ATP-binding protein n=1 Tax=Aquisalibacillus elongatus TaxID=485577 RepID=A0A3N5AXN4_9BACI|nr:energy-coupling factor transporter ATPase [Aquisalibacillus elongatus]RPF50016.1 energy-coupling factor transport system ATP-binding protein [Aquisalibacillus elongatus]